MRSRRQVHAGRPSGRLRFLARVLLCVVVLTWIPTIAQAAFTGRTDAPLSVGTYAIPAPAGITGTYSCTNNRTTMSVTISDVGAVNRATGYTVTLTAPSGQVTTNNLPAGNRATTISRTSSRTGVFLLHAHASVGTWTGASVEYNLTCP